MVQDSAFRSRRAWIIVDAGIDALHVDARVIAWAIAVAVAADHAAPIQRIAMIALAAAAVGHVVVREALGIGATRVRDQARIHAIVVLAGLVERALAVVPALDGVTGDFGVALVVLLARANRFVVPHVASSVGTAVAGVATLPVDARLAITAVIVRRARSNDRQLYYKIAIIYLIIIYRTFLYCFRIQIVLAPLTWPAYTVDVGDPTLRARANHGPYRYRIENITTSVLQTRFDDRARINALLPDAHQLV